MNRFRRLGTTFAAALAACCGLLVCFNPPAQATEDPWMSKVVSLQGEVRVRRSGRTDWMPVALDDRLYMGDTLHVSRNSRAAVVLRNDSVLRIGQQTTLLFQEVKTRKSFLLNLIEGAAFFFSRKRHTLEVATPFVNGVVEGTEFLMRVDGGKTDIILYEGALRAQNPHGEVIITKNQAVEARKDRPPVTTTPVRPRDAVQWALYYPPILAVRPADIAVRAPDDWQTRLHHSMQAYARGDLSGAFDAIADVDKEVADTRFFIYRAGLNLAVGHIEPARRDIARALSLDAQSSAAMALRSIIAVVQNRKADALKDAETAVAMDERSAAAHIALSYARQSIFELTAALAAARSATEAEPADNIAWARLAELELSVGDPDAALAAARNAAGLPPAIAHTHSILGFAYLTQIKIDRAEKAFTEAIRLDSAAPLPRLGLGLAKIRRGDLKAGRAEIEIAAGLAPDNALIRSYLGKAYFEEKRGPLDQRQFETAKNLDPKDPTPWFYDAIRKQTENRPVEALRDLQKSIELNDNRAVYRSRLLLDEDLAARSASLGRIYKALGFQELSIRQGCRSLSVDPANYSAHRLLADSYSSRPRHEIARVSELLQSQLLQPLNITPIQPQLAESNIEIIESAGPISASLNELNTLFAKDSMAVRANGVVGGNETIGDELSIAGIYNRFSLNLGQFHHETDGFRENNDIDQDIYDIFTQTAISQKVNIQAEFRWRETHLGDLSNNFNGIFNSTLRKKEETGTQRLGLHYKPTGSSSFIVSYIQKKIQEDVHGSTYQYKDEFGGYLAEGQYLYVRPLFSVVLGSGRSEIDNELGGIGTFDDENSSFYIYSQINQPKRFNWTLGASYDAVDDGYSNKKLEEFNPKFGLAWHPFSKTEFRIAYTSMLKRNIIAKQTVEPTHVAGFNQLFDDFKGSLVELYGAAIDQKIGNNLCVGAEYYQRQLDVPFYLRTGLIKENWDENHYRAYLYNTFFNSFAFKAEYSFEDFDRDVIDSRRSTPLEMDTQVVPLSLSYFSQFKYYIRATNTFVNQSVTTTSGKKETDAFSVSDFSLGYLFPKRYGELCLTIMNIFDNRFNYQGIESRQTQAYHIFPVFSPDRLFLLKVNFSF